MRRGYRGYGLDYNANLTLEEAGLPSSGSVEITFGEPVIIGRAQPVSGTKVLGLALLIGAAYLVLR